MKALLVSFTLLALCACAPITEMDGTTTPPAAGEEDQAARLAECTQAAGAMQQRLEAIEAENLRLDDANRELTATVAELRAQVSTAQAERTVPAPPDAGAGTRATDAAAAPPLAPPHALGAPAGGLSAVAYDAKVRPSMEFLTQYQQALERFNGGETEIAYQQFGQLITSSAPIA